jgi:hypothetical protein
LSKIFIVNKSDLTAWFKQNFIIYICSKYIEYILSLSLSLSLYIYIYIYVYIYIYMGPTNRKSRGILEWGDLFDLRLCVFRLPDPFSTFLMILMSACDALTLYNFLLTKVNCTLNWREIWTYVLKQFQQKIKKLSYLKISYQRLLLTHLTK